MTAREFGFAEQFLPDMDRRIAGMIRYGTIAELSEKGPQNEGPRVRVKLGDITTGWIPWGTGRSGADKTWSAPEPGEQVMIAAPSGELDQACVICTIPQDSQPAPGDTKDKTVTLWQDGARLEYDRSTNTHTHTLPDAGTFVFKVGNSTLTMTSAGTVLETPQLTVKASDSITLDTPETHITGNVQIDGDTTISGDTSVQAITSRGKDISSTHKHLGVMSGPSITGVPV